VISNNSNIQSVNEKTYIKAHNLIDNTLSVYKIKYKITEYIYI